MLAQAFCYLQYSRHTLWYARPAQAFSHPSLSTNPLNTQPVSRWSRTCFPQDKQALFKSCNNINLIFIISANGSVARKYLSFICLWITMRYTVICHNPLYVLGRFLCVHVCCDQICICVFYNIGSSRKGAHPGTKLLSVCGHTYFGAYVCVVFRTQRTWTHI